MGLAANCVCLCLGARSSLLVDDDSMLIIFPNYKRTPYFFLIVSETPNKMSIGANIIK